MIKILTFWAREFTIVTSATRAIITTRTQCCIHNSCIGSVTVITFWTRLAIAFATFILEGTIFTPDWLWCANFTEVTRCTEVFSWCCCALATRAVIIGSAFICRLKIPCTSAEPPRGTISAICKFCVLWCIGEFAFRASDWNSCS